MTAPVSMSSDAAALPIGVVYDPPDRLLVDALLAEVRRERDRRLVQRFALDDEISARQLLGHPTQPDAREDELRSCRTDVDADRQQGDVVLLPQTRRRRVVFPADVVVVMIVIVIRLAVLVPMGGIHPEEVVVEGVPAFFGVVGHTNLASIT